MSVDYPPYLSLTGADRQEMLEELGLREDELWQGVPEHLLDEFEAEEPPLSEQRVLAWHYRASGRNETVLDRTCFRGGGMYDHQVPSPVLSVLSREEFLTSYTPYQAEMNQGSLQAMFEYQSMISTLTGLPITNASLYDGATAFAEAVLMAAAVTDRDAIYYSPNLWTSWINVMKTYAEPLGWKLIPLPSENGRASFPDSWKTPPAAVAMMYPNRWGNADDVASWSDRRPDDQTVGICGINPLALGVLEPPGKLGWDVAVGEGQPLGLPLNAGGPDLGIFSAEERFLRHVPGRLVGVTEDQNDNRCYVLTLQTREQHIRRERATSNVCTNHALMTVAAAVAIGSLGKRGLLKRASTNVRRGARLRTVLEDRGFSVVGDPVFNEVTVEFSQEPTHLNQKMRDRGWIGGLIRGQRYTCAATEKRSPDEIRQFVDDLEVNIHG